MLRARKAFPVAAAITFGIGVALCAQNAPPARSPKGDKPAAKAKAKGAFPGNVRTPKPFNANQEIERLANMTPAQRQQALAGLPPRRQQQIEQGLARYLELTPQQRQNRAARAEKLQALPSEEQQQVRQAAQTFRQLPDDRQAQIRKELNRLRKLNPQDRERYLESTDFKNRFPVSEQEIVERMSQVLPDPQH